MLLIHDVPPRPKLFIRRCAARGGGPAQPVELFERIAAARLRLHRTEGEVLADRSWPSLDRWLARYTDSLALTPGPGRAFRSRSPSGAVATILAELHQTVSICSTLMEVQPCNGDSSAP